MSNVDNKRLIVVNGSMGVGKTTVCKRLNNLLPNSVFLDGDWCWDMNPRIVNDSTKAMLEKNICFLLNSFIENSYIDNIIFCWVLHKESIWHRLCSNLNILDENINRFTLTCSHDILTSRMIIGNRTEQNIKNSLLNLHLFESQNTEKIDTSYLTVEEITEKIMKKLV